MELDIAGDRDAERAHFGLRQGVQRCLQLLDEPGAVATAKIGPGVRDRGRGEGHGTHGPRLEPASFFVGPGNDLDRQIRFDPGILKAFHRLEGRKGSQSAIEASAGRLAVEVAADDEGGLFGKAAFAPDEQVRHRILKHAKTARERALGQKAP
ncbi:hypothetical protein D9M68_475940 [compost metagenome]